MWMAVRVTARVAPVRGVRTWLSQWRAQRVPWELRGVVAWIEGSASTRGTLITSGFASATCCCYCITIWLQVRVHRDTCRDTAHVRLDTDTCALLLWSPLQFICSRFPRLPRGADMVRGDAWDQIGVEVSKRQMATIATFNKYFVPHFLWSTLYSTMGAVRNLWVLLSALDLSV